MQCIYINSRGRNDLIDVIYGYNIGIKAVFDDGFEEFLINQKGYDGLNTYLQQEILKLKL